jgi:protein-tyrosine-phosphatase
MSETRHVLFVCQHGAAKSVLAARHFERFARERGVYVVCEAAGLEPYESVPPEVVAGLQDDGFEDTPATPRQLTEELLRGADTVVTFGCDISTVGSPATHVNWDGVPAVSDDFAVARDDITKRMQSLLDELKE